MPGANELLGLVIAVLICWVLLKVARLAIKLFLFVIAIGIVFGAWYWVAVR
jgi:hypothetical protein